MKILIADDSIVTRTHLLQLLSAWGYEVMVACDGNEARQLLESPEAPKLAILDWVMPGIDGIDLCRQIRSWPDKINLHILLLTAKDRMEDIVSGLEAGADDYLIKPFHELELKARLNAYRRIIEGHEQLLALARHDSLTGLWNHAAICEFFEKELARARRNGTGIGVILVDLDYFKQINDTFGHLTGDAVLREAAVRMQSSLRSYDGLGRYGGEEFLIVAPECQGPRLQDLAERLRQSLGGKPFETPEGPVKITGSLGAVAVTADLDKSFEFHLRAADKALYQAKAAGRNQVVLAC